MKKLLALKGKGNSGKTSTIKQVYDLLIKKYPDAEVITFEPSTIDIKVIVTINGISVGIESQGDPNSRLQSSLKDFTAHGCLIIVCATRTSGMTVGWVNNYAASHEIEFICQQYVKKQEQASNNEKTAKLLLSKIETVLNV